jgi:hypothetical protein
MGKKERHDKDGLTTDEHSAAQPQVSGFELKRKKILTEINDFQSE